MRIAISLSGVDGWTAPGGPGLVPALRYLILSGHAESVYGERALAAGALAYVDKRTVREIE